MRSLHCDPPPWLGRPGKPAAGRLARLRLAPVWLGLALLAVFLRPDDATPGMLVQPGVVQELDRDLREMSGLMEVRFRGGRMGGYRNYNRSYGRSYKSAPRHPPKIRPPRATPRAKRPLAPRLRPKPPRFAGKAQLRRGLFGARRVPGPRAIAPKVRGGARDFSPRSLAKRVSGTRGTSPKSGHKARSFFSKGPRRFASAKRGLARGLRGVSRRFAGNRSARAVGRSLKKAGSAVTRATGKERRFATGGRSTRSTAFRANPVRLLGGRAAGRAKAAGFATLTRARRGLAHPLGRFKSAGQTLGTRAQTRLRTTPSAGLARHYAAKALARLSRAGNPVARRGVGPQPVASLRSSGRVSLLRGGGRKVARAAPPRLRRALPAKPRPPAPRLRPPQGMKGLRAGPRQRFLGKALRRMPGRTTLRASRATGEAKAATDRSRAFRGMGLQQARHLRGHGIRTTGRGQARALASARQSRLRPGRGTTRRVLGAGLRRAIGPRRTFNSETRSPPHRLANLTRAARGQVRLAGRSVRALTRPHGVRAQTKLRTTPLAGLTRARLGKTLSRARQNLVRRVDGWLPVRTLRGPRQTSMLRGAGRKTARLAPPRFQRIALPKPRPPRSVLRKSTGARGVAATPRGRGLRNAQVLSLRTWARLGVAQRRAVALRSSGKFYRPHGSNTLGRTVTASVKRQIAARRPWHSGKHVLPTVRRSFITTRFTASSGARLFAKPTSKAAARSGRSLAPGVGAGFRKALHNRPGARQKTRLRTGLKAVAAKKPITSARAHFKYAGRLAKTVVARKFANVSRRNQIRSTGKQVGGFSVQKLPVAFADIRTAVKATGGKAYQIGRFSTKNAFVLEVKGKYHIFVNPNYGDYRRLAKRINPDLKPSTHVDHVASRALEKKLGQGFVRLGQVRGSVNTSHGALKETGPVPVREFNTLARNSPAQGTLSYATKDMMDKLANRAAVGKGHQAMTKNRAAGYSEKELKAINNSLFLDKKSQGNLKNLITNRIM